MTYHQELNDLLTIKQDKENELSELKNKYNDILARLNEVKSELLMTQQMIINKKQEINKVNEAITNKHNERDIMDVIFSIQHSLPNHEMYILSSDINKSTYKKRIKEYLKNNSDKWKYKSKISKKITKRGYKLV